MTTFSRRALLRAMPAFGLGMGGQAWSGPPPSNDGQDEGSSVLESWVDRYGRPTASVRLNDQGPFAFQVDTGSTTTAISTRLAAQLGFVASGQATVVGTTGTAIAPTIRVDRLQTGAVTRRDIRLAVLPDESFSKAGGILGADVFAGKRLEFNIRSKIVRVESSRNLVRSSRPTNLRIRNGLLAEVDGRVGSISTRLMLDTGAQHCIANPTLDAALRRAHPHLKRVPGIRVIGVTGHELTGELLTLPKVDLSTFSARDVAAIVADAPVFHYWKLTDEPAMIVGVDLLSQLATFSIDYGARFFDATLMASLLARNTSALG